MQENHPFKGFFSVESLYQCKLLYKILKIHVYIKNSHKFS